MAIKVVNYNGRQFILTREQVDKCIAYLDAQEHRKLLHETLKQERHLHQAACKEHHRIPAKPIMEVV